MVLAIASLGYAAWTSAGNGSGVAKATTAQGLTTVTATASAGLYPGATAALQLQVNNPNPYPVTVTDVTGNGTITADASHSTCGQDATHPTGVTYTDQHNLSIAVPANGTTSVSVSNSVHMSNASDNSCQGATFTIPVSLTGASAATS
ncbi:MAG TPA: hypothetical protein VMF14_23660 [Solirubrobacteraceae bacterium]|nr:hypothetical protein [Solirubrobacteraceae bacterium]